MAVTAAATKEIDPTFAAKITMKQGDAWLNSAYNTAKGFVPGLHGDNPNAEKNLFLLLSHKDTQYGHCENDNISVYNAGNLVGFIGYRDETKDLILVQEFLKDLPEVKLEDLHTTRDSDIVSMFE